MKITPAMIENSTQNMTHEERELVDRLSDLTELQALTVMRVVSDRFKARKRVRDLRGKLDSVERLAVLLTELDRKSSELGSELATISEQAYTIAFLLSPNDSKHSPHRRISRESENL